MQAITLFLRKLLILISRDNYNRELDEEMDFHREQVRQEMQSDSLPAADAQHAVRRQFGNDVRLKEQSHEIVGFRIESVWQDFRFALRQLHKNPGFACVAIMVLTMGIAASVAIFSFVDAALIKPLPYQNPSRLVGVYETSAACPHCNLSYQDYLDWKKDNKVFSSFDAWGWASYLWKSPSGVQTIPAARVAGGFFHTLGVSPAVGRVFTEADDTPGAPRTALLAYSTWQKRFGGNQDVVGKSLMLDDAAYTIIGVLPPEFHFAPRGEAEFWTTLHDPNNCEKRRSCHNLFGIARLNDGVSIQTALANMKSIAAQLEKQYPDSNLGQGALVMSLSDAIVGDIRPILLVLLSGAGLLLLIACVNVSSLLLVRAENRKREMAVRGALGASPARLIRQFITEGIVLVAASMICGLAMAYGAIQLLLKLIPSDMLLRMPYLQSIGLNPRVLAFAAALGIFSAAIFSLTPALRLSIANLREDLAEGGRSAAGTTWKRLGSNLVALELAIAVVLLAGAGLLGKSFYRLLHVNLNFNPDHLALFEISAPNANYEKPPQSIALSKRVLDSIASMPGVVIASHTSDPPVTCNCDTTWFRVQGHPFHGEHNDAPERSVSTDYFKTIQARLIRGRFYTEADDASSTPAIIINQTLAKQFFPNEDPIGKMIGDTELSPKSLRQIVGVVDDIREGGLDQEIRPAVYYPFVQSTDDDFEVVVRTAQDPKSMLPALVKVIHEIDPNIGVRNELTMEQQISDSETAYLHRSSAWLVGGFAILALLLSVVGLYGVIAYSVSQRTREIGVRMALGAQRSSVYQLILKEATWLITFGIFAGLAGSLALTALMGKLLFGVHSWDVPTLTAVALLLGLSALLASYIPARRAASVNPVEALRAE
ncbi:ABC transporter permease [Alloacidobacterium dinghuense]|uniref:ABC transporter permease n=1 Tax=Alloacidobacterium dinghuense TaxID=2763107 RepID=A0A7G8BK49_9BACT|nr:ABC transporter permease [Alloacidobacterium dinghuense]QNI32919.1 ABC transporter permease [Alloacidobacterium dinghuense]